MTSQMNAFDKAVEYLSGTLWGAFVLSFLIVGFSAVMVLGLWALVFWLFISPDLGS